MDTEDVSLYRQHGERLAELMGLLVGCIVLNGATDSMRDLDVEVLDRELARRGYHWPTAWPITWMGLQEPAMLNLKQVTLTSIWDWAIGGFPMAVVDGELEYGAGLTQSRTLLT